MALNFFYPKVIPFISQNQFFPRPDYFMNKDEVSELLERNGFKTIDMKEMNGLTYFYSQNVHQPF